MSRSTESRVLFALALSAVLHIAVLAAITAAVRGRTVATASVPPTPTVMQVEWVSAPSSPGATPAQQALSRPGVQRQAATARPAPFDVPPNAPVVATTAPEPIGNTAASIASVEGAVPVTRSTEIPTAASTPSRYLDAPKPEYPLAAREDEEEGVVVLRVHVSSRGLPTEVHVDRSSGFVLLDRAAISAVRRWTFAAATNGGLAVESWMEVPIRFRLNEP